MSEIELYVDEINGIELGNRIKTILENFDGLCTAEFEDNNFFVKTGDMSTLHDEEGDKLLKYNFFNTNDEFIHIERLKEGVYSWVTNIKKLAKGIKSHRLAYCNDVIYPFYLWGTIYRGGGYFESIIPKIHQYPLENIQEKTMRVVLDARCMIDEFGNVVFYHFCNLRGATNE
jgi:hypothetical protein